MGGIKDLIIADMNDDCGMLHDSISYLVRSFLRRHSNYENFILRVLLDEWKEMENCKVRIEEGTIEAEERGIYKLSTFVKKNGDKLEVDERRISDITRRIILGD